MRIPAVPAALAFLSVMFGSSPVAQGQRSDSAWPPRLEFEGLRVGIPVSELRRAIGNLEGSLSCHRSTDPRIRECTGQLRLTRDSSRYAITVSLVDDSAAVLILTGAASRPVLRAWADSISTVQGRASVRIRGPQLVWQWVRRRQMLRLIQRNEGARDVAVVTLTDGPLLDGLGARPDP